MDRMVSELQESDTNFNMFWISEWHRSGTSTHNHLLLKGEITDLIDKHWTSKGLGIKKYIKHLEYDNNKGANYYLCKYIDRNIDYDYV